MKNLLILSLLVLCVGCSEKPSKNIDLVCEGSFTAKGVAGIPEKSFNLHVIGNKYTLTQGDHEDMGKCNWEDTELTCTSDNSLEVWVRVNRYSLSYLSRYDSVTSEGRCNVLQKAI